MTDRTSARQQEWEQAVQATRAKNEDLVLANVAELDPNDKSANAQALRETAASIRDHRAMEERRAGWEAEDKAAAARQEAMSAFDERDALRAEAEQLREEATTAATTQEQNAKWEQAMKVALDMQAADDRGNAAVMDQFRNENLAKQHDRATQQYQAANSRADDQAKKLAEAAAKTETDDLVEKNEKYLEDRDSLSEQERAERADDIAAANKAAEEAQPVDRTQVNEAEARLREDAAVDYSGPGGDHDLRGDAFENQYPETKNFEDLTDEDVKYLTEKYGEGWQGGQEARLEDAAQEDAYRPSAGTEQPPPDLAQTDFPTAEDEKAIKEEFAREDAEAKLPNPLHDNGTQMTDEETKAMSQSRDEGIDWDQIEKDHGREIPQEERNMAEMDMLKADSDALVNKAERVESGHEWVKNGIEEAARKGKGVEEHWADQQAGYDDYTTEQEERAAGLPSAQAADFSQEPVERTATQSADNGWTTDPSSPYAGFTGPSDAECYRYTPVQDANTSAVAE